MSQYRTHEDWPLLVVRGAFDARRHMSGMHDIDYSQWRFLNDIGNYIVHAAVAAYAYFATRKKKIAKTIADLQGNIDNRCENRLKRIEALEKDEISLRLKMEQLPTHQDIKELHNRMDTMAATLSEIGGRLEGINRAVDLINEFLINQGGRGNA